jgi:hypothetical protein
MTLAFEFVYLLTVPFIKFSLLFLYTFVCSMSIDGSNSAPESSGPSSCCGASVGVSARRCSRKADGRPGEIFALSFGCIPLSYFWNRLEPGGRCTSPTTTFTVQAALDALTDVLVLLLPMPLVWRLRVSLQKKMLITLTFIVGG